MSSGRAGRLLGPIVAVVLRVSFVTPAVAVAQSDWIWGQRGDPGGHRLERIDQQTGNVLSISLVSHQIAGRYAALSHRLVVVNGQTPPRINLVHPADFSFSLVGTTIYGAGGIPSIEVHGPTNTIYLSDPSTLFTASWQSGGAIPVAAYQGFAASWDLVSCIAIDKTGYAVALGRNLFTGTANLYELDLATAQLTWIADLAVLDPTGEFNDATFDAAGDLWASFGFSTTPASARGLYKYVRANGYSGNIVRVMQYPYIGLAWLPPTVQASYCSSKLGSTGCAPTIAAEGFPSPTAPSGYTIRASSVRNQSAGTLVFSLNGRAQSPFGGGTLCVAAPWARTTLQHSGGTGLPAQDCSGAWQLDFNAWMSSHFTLPAGTLVQCQWLGRDPGFAAPNNWALSNALDFTIRE